MAIDREFLDRLDREIASLKGRIESEKQDAGTATETQARLRQLEDTRERLIAQSTGG